MRIRNQKGFTLIELIVVSAIIAILAGILVPIIIHEVDESKIARAKADLKALQTAIAKFRMDNSAWPNRTNGADPTTNTVQVLSSEGNTVTSASDWPMDPTVNKMLSSYLTGSANDRNYPAAGWKGPYMSAVSADPWGNTYLVGTLNFEPVPPIDPNIKYPVWIISAGPDGIIQTSINSEVCYDGKSIVPDGSGSVAAGDDICLRFK